MIVDPAALPGPEPVLRLEGIGKRYAGAECDALRDVSLELGTDELLAVVGQSGCGKTTLLRIVAGLEVPDAGSVRIGGRVVAGDEGWTPPERRGVGMVFQDFGLFPHLRVEQNVAYGLGRLPRAQRRPRVEELLELVDLAGLGRRYPHQLSGGQQQRVALARALAPEPRLLLLDEPFSNLDRPLKAALRESLVRVLRRTAVPTLLVVHDAEDVLVLADRVAVLQGGRIVREGTPGELCRNPGDAYVERFFQRLRLPDANRLPDELPSGSLPAGEEPLGPA